MASVKPVKILTCYICLQKNTLILIKPRSEWRNLFEFCIGLPVRRHLRAFHSICLKCAKVLQEFGKFKQRCLLSSTFWNYLSVQPEIHAEKCDSIANGIHKIKDEKPDYWSETCSNVDIVEYMESVGENEIKTEEKYKIKITGQPVKTEVQYELTLNDNKESLDVKAKSPSKRRTRRTKTDNQVNTLDDTDWLSDEKTTCKRNKKAEKKGLDVEPMCGICLYTSSEGNTGVNKHFLENHCGDNQLKCQLCDFVGRDAADMVGHRYTHYHPRTISCPSCVQRPRTSIKLEYHYRRVHLKKPGYWCQICGYQCTWKVRLCHELRHRGIQFICDYCNKDFLQKCTLKDHILHLHSEKRDQLKIFVCELCGDKFSKKYNLYNHLGAKHSAVQKVNCTHCKRKFKNKEYLDKHLKRVYSEKPFVCEICSKRFLFAFALKEHLFYHTTERPFECKLCGGKYRSKSSLVGHMRVHAGTGPHKCSNCDSMFKTSANLKRHQCIRNIVTLRLPTKGINQRN